ncbi:MAG: ABC transporter substrate-binding protein [Oscillibacter sp.]|nr:ABC transporter substrate-binding protein [Oscillibacter sp.]
MKRIIALLLTLVMVLGLCACGAKETPVEEKPSQGTEAPAETPADVPVVKVGALYPFSGGSATAGPEAQFLIDMVVDKVNAEGGLDALGGAKLEVIYGDTQADGQVALTEFERLVNVEGVTSLLGGYNTAVANTLSQYVAAAQVPMLMTSAAGNDAYSVENRYVYHANSCSANDYATQVAMNEYWAELCGSPRTSLVVYDSADYGAQAWEDKQKAAEATGNTVVGVPVVSGAADYSAEIAKIAENVGVAAYIEPTLIMDDAIRFMKQMHEKGVSMPVFASGGGYLQGDFIQQCGDAAEYVFSTAWYFADLANASYDPEWALEICDAFEAEFGYPFNENASCVWTGIWALIDALERTTADDPDAIVEALEATDIKGEHPALLLTLADHIKYEDGPMSDGTVLYNTNRYENSVAWAYIKDGAYRVVLPEAQANKNYPLEWPIPAVADR